METEPKKFSYKVNEEKTLDCHYFFSDDGVNKDSGYINLFIAPNDPDKPDIGHIKIDVPETVLDQSEKEKERIARSELASFYIISNAANN